MLLAFSLVKVLFSSNETAFLTQSCESGIIYGIMQVKLYHPDSDDLAFLYGTIVTDGEDEWSDKPTAHILCFGSNGQVCILAKITLKLFVFDKKFKSRFFPSVL